MGGLVSQQTNGVQPLEDVRADDVFKVGGLKSFKESIAWLTRKPQVLEDDSNKHFRKASKLDHGRLRIRISITLRITSMLV